MVLVEAYLKQVGRDFKTCFRVIQQGASYYLRYYFIDMYKYILYIFQ